MFCHIIQQDISSTRENGEMKRLILQLLLLQRLDRKLKS